MRLMAGGDAPASVLRIAHLSLRPSAVTSYEDAKAFAISLRLAVIVDETPQSRANPPGFLDPGAMRGLIADLWPRAHSSRVFPEPL